MLRKVSQLIKTNKLFKPGDTVVTAVSGGADSVALLDVLAGLKHMRLRLVVAHLNHCLRGAESDGDEAFVRELAARYGLSFVTKAVDVVQLSRGEKRSLEEAGREARYRFFAEIATDCKADRVALAHHADDQAETVLMRLIRGAGAGGLRAMSPITAGLFVRPLLNVTRSEIESYLTKKGLPFRTDSSNGDTAFLRNRIRHELIPYLRTYNPGITDRLVTTAVSLTEDEQILNGLAEQALQKHLLRSDAGGDPSLDVVGLAKEPRGLRMRVYRLLLQRLKGDLAKIGARHLYDIDGLLLSTNPSAKAVLAAGVTARREYGRLNLRMGEEIPPDPYEIQISGPGCYRLPGGGTITVGPAVVPANLPAVPASIGCFDADKLPFPWLVRSFRDGDAFYPFGMGRKKKVKNLFIDRKIPVPLRRRIPLLFSGETLFWVAGILPAEAGRITTSTNSVMKVEITGLTD